MTGYEIELAELPGNYQYALSANISDLKLAVAGAAQSSVIGVGSGGSYTVASLLCNLHEAFTGRVSRPSTPLELISNPTLASASPVFLVSAEGKNPDIVEALERARRYSSRSIHVLSNRPDSDLITHVRQLPDVTPHVFELAKKDGYLATNSLLVDATLVARAYGELDRASPMLPPHLEQLRIGPDDIPSWLSRASDFAKEAASRDNMIVIFSPLLRPVAADLESKLSEAALLHCQLADIRSFAHGRHLWLADRLQDCTLLVLLEPGVEKLWAGMESLLPESTPVLRMSLSGAHPSDLISGLVAQMHLVAAIATQKGRDPARPSVPEFGRKLYYLDIASLIPRPEDAGRRGEQSKTEVLGSRWPAPRMAGALRRALDSFESALKKQSFRAIVFDYDGTLCSSQKRDAPPGQQITSQLTRLLEAGVIVGVASGRGDSVQEHLRSAIAPQFWAQLYLGLYNGGWFGSLDADIRRDSGGNEFLSHVRRLMQRLSGLGAPIDQVRATYPYQISIRFKDGVSAESMWFVVADTLRQAGLGLSAIVKSKHSVDVLAKNVDKSHVVADIIQARNLDPHQVVTMGDQGAWPGNDSSLLEHRFSLSVDQPSRRLDRGWKLAPDHTRDVDATLWYLSRTSLDASGKSFTFSF